MSSLETLQIILLYIKYRIQCYIRQYLQRNLYKTQSAGILEPLFVHVASKTRPLDLGQHYIGPSNQPSCSPVRLILANHCRPSRPLAFGSHAGRRLLLPPPPPQALLRGTCQARVGAAIAARRMAGAGASVSLTGGGPYLRIAGCKSPPAASHTREPATPMPGPPRRAGGRGC